MSVYLVRKVLARTDLKSNNKIVLVALADTYHDKKGRCYPSVQLIAKKSGMTRRNTQRMLKQLESSGYIKVYKDTETWSNEYALMFALEYKGYFAKESKGVTYIYRKDSYVGELEG